ncbi:hypothetical protein F7D20_04445 [Prevotella copri]|uniref:Uncharacterized protein n=1 Tax=Segatella copri TaxID=165179 RepID=A0A6A7WA51_9BACT|nr:hypothetical protein [Segatella copri]MQP11228.1 hypothetical protein [Segatella copri]
MRKKLQQQRYEAAQKRFTSVITFLVVLLFVIGGSLQVQAQDTNTNGTHITGIESLTGCSKEDVRDAVISDNTFPEDDKNKIFFLYNVKTGLLLNAGGYWGTHVSLKEYGMPLWIHIDKNDWIHLGQKFDSKESKEEGNYLEYETGNKPSEDNGVYIDRAYIYKGTTGLLNNIIKRGWKLEAVSGKTNTYRLYTYSTTSWSTNIAPSFDETKYYLIAAKTQGDVDRNCYVVKEGNKEITEHNDEWRFLSYQQILDLQHENTNNIISSIDLTFRLQCPGFSRENAAMSNWKAYQYRRSEEGKIRLGLEHYYKPYVNSDVTTAGYCTISELYTNDFENKTIKNYKFPDGSNAITFTGNKNYERHCGKYYCADAKNFRGTIYQDVKVSHSGAYVIECKGFSTTTKAKLYACLVNADNTADTKTMHATVLGQTDYMSAQEKKALHIEEQNMDYAAKEFYGSHKYFNSVLVQVPEGGGTIRFGIEIGTKDDTTVPGESEKEWTVFDDFRLLYTSRTIDGDLVLDQDRDNLEYLKCSNTYKSVTLHLNKTFDKDKWNGFVLPVSLTKDQLTQAFGPNVKLAKLAKLTSNEIQFVSINMSTVGNDEIAMQAYIPYIIFPTKHAEQEQTPAYTASLSKIVNGQAEKVSVIIGKNHIDIPNVSFAVVDGKNENDLSNMNTKNWTTNSSIVVKGSGTPFFEGNGTMTAFGTFARTFGKGTQNNTTDKDKDDYGKWTITDKSTIIAGRSDLKGCYFFSNGKMYTSAKRARGLRGFSVWFAPTTASDGNPAKPANVFLDGVSLDKTTGISPIIYGEEESRIDRFAHGIYSLNGQLISNSSSLDGLPSGIYILNGKKVIKR